MSTKSIMFFSAVLVFVSMFSGIFEKDCLATNHRELIITIADLAKKGKVLDCNLAIGCTIKEVIAEFGKPDRRDEGELVYIKKELVFLYDTMDGNKVFCIQKTNKSIQDLALDELKAEFKDVGIIESTSFITKTGNYFLRFAFEEKPHDPMNPKIKRVQVEGDF